MQVRLAGLISWGHKAVKLKGREVALLTGEKTAPGPHACWELTKGRRTAGRSPRPRACERRSFPALRGLEELLGILSMQIPVI